MVRNPPANAGDIRDAGSIPGSGRSPGEERDYLLQCSCLESPLDRGAQRTIVHGLAKSRTGQKGLSTHVLWAGSAAVGSISSPRGVSILQDRKWRTEKYKRLV